MERTTQGNPWKGLASYTYQDAGRFFGRDQELHDIALVIKQNAFTTLYGISGAGKTSVINAGLFPLLDKQSFLPIYIRLDHNLGHVPYDVQIIKAVNKALEGVEAESEDIVGHRVNSEQDCLWLFFHSHRFWSKDNHVICPIIFIDQFEEIFTKNDEAEDIWYFFNIIDSLQYSTPTDRILQAMEKTDQFASFGEELNFRMVFSMREDFLARLEDYSYNIPSLRKNRIGLKPLNGLQALDVILKPCPDMVSRKVALHIISKVVGKNITDNERKLETTSVDTSILSLFCTELYNYAIKDNKGEITIPLVDLYGGNILEWFYDRNMQELPRHTYVYLENQLLTHSGFRNSVALENLLENGVLQSQLDKLAENRIVRIEDVNHNFRVEFTHDVLCKIAKKRKDERDKVERLKGEKMARRAFTIDNAILFSTFALSFLAVYYARIDEYYAITFFTLPYIAFFYMLIANRSVSDRNLSYVVWFVLGNIALELVIAAVRDKIGSVSSVLFDVVTVSFALPILAVGLMPFALIVKKYYKARFPVLRNFWRSVALYVLFLIVQTGLLALAIFNYSIEISHDNFYINLIPYVVPSILLALVPFAILFRNKGKGSSWVMPGMTCAYSLFLIVLPFSLSFWDGGHYWQSSEGDANIIGISAVWLAIGILSVIYAVQNSKQPKQQSFMEYYEKVLRFQAFEKYKSFSPRLQTILTIFFVFLSAVVATRYFDLLPFFTLPIAVILVLHSGCQEFKLTFPKKAFSLLVIVPVFILSETIAGCQYVIGSFKMPIVFASAALLVVLTFGYLIRREQLTLSRWKFVLRLSLFSIFVGIALPLICLGYNVFNSELGSLRRVWGGSVSSDARNLFFMTVENESGLRGVMDYSEVIVPVEYQSVSPYCYINRDLVETIYPARYLLMDLLEIRHRGSGYSYYYSDHADFEEILSFWVKSSKSTTLSGLDFLKFDNKYGRAYIKKWKSEYYGSSMSKTLSILDESDKCLTVDERRQAIVKLFVSELVQAHTGQNAFDFRVGNNFSSSDILRVLRKCYDNATLSPLFDNVDLLRLDKVCQACVSVADLMTVDKDRLIEKQILGRLWDLLPKTSEDANALAERSYLYLFTGNYAEAEKQARSYLEKHPENAVSFSNLYLALYMNGDSVRIADAANSYMNSDFRNSELAIEFYNDIIQKIQYLNNVGIVQNSAELENRIKSFISSRELLELENINNPNDLNEMAYDYARRSEFGLAMTCLDRAIRIDPEEANYYDSRGEILLMQGKVDEATEMWGQVMRLDPSFLDTHDSNLYGELYRRGLINGGFVDNQYEVEEVVEAE